MLFISRLQVHVELIIDICICICRFLSLSSLQWENHALLQVRCFKWQVVCSLNRTQGCQKQQQGYLFQMNAVTPLKTSQQAHAKLVSYTE